ncbi:efflux RND transporter periplasmic adaptor subunit [Paenibacillus aceris]|uniref:Multidrug efflux pump subunit AcrA (Membrane-fusion protein) n=1 Tax=Paenibacillus aceris TaxID=869555 RepID=A0ABS4I9X0_9BACL|nr:HlyD family efflux transporter periplasmic adaptor subunit [Paenibacillus aceris]MBP1967161.1 multidrug efflux pump subunit AcrA (membrane-fusion protein) [Paenibacillus aceris]NHW35559.1 HlyD family efflux transporter periplasmic adaptor subunit [Paenibacillus aceris]
MVLKRQRLLTTLFILFFIVLAGLTLFSNTFQTALLPKVTTEKPVKKTLTHTIRGGGVITPKQKNDVVSDNGWKVAKVNVSKNDQVKKGQVLITFDDTADKQQLLDEEDRLKKMSLNREALKEQFVAAQQEGDEAKIRKAKRDLEIDQLDTDIAQRKVDSMRNDLSEKSTLKAPFDGIVADIKAKEGTATPQGQSLITLVNTHEGYELSFSTNEDSAALLQIGEAVTPVVTKDGKPLNVKGTITEIKDGQTVSGDGQGGSTKPGGGGGAEDGGVDSGGKPQKTVVIAVSGEGIQGSEQATVRIEKQANLQGLVISKEMLKKDGADSYVFVVREKKSPLGNSYYVQKAKVNTGDETEEGIIVLSGIAPQEEIIKETSEPLQDGNRIRLN